MLAIIITIILWLQKCNFSSGDMNADFWKLLNILYSLGICVLSPVFLYSCLLLLPLTSLQITLFTLPKVQTYWIGETESQMRCLTSTPNRFPCSDRYVINNRSRKDPYLGSRPPSLIHLTWPLSSSFLMNGFDNFLIIKASGPSQTWIFNAFH